MIDDFFLEYILDFDRMSIVGYVIEIKTERCQEKTSSKQNNISRLAHQREKEREKNEPPRHRGGSSLEEKTILRFMVTNYHFLKYRLYRPSNALP